jgi:3-hydroxyethyl bacteriochlorophyllide a dehydrogenase
MPPFPGMGYPLVPGYESVGRVVEAGAESGRRSASGSSCPARVATVRSTACSAVPRRASSSRARLLPVPDGLGEQGVLLALAATPSRRRRRRTGAGT